MSRRLLTSLLAAAALLALPAGASAAQSGPIKAPHIIVPKLNVNVGGLKGGAAEIDSTVPVTGTISPYVPGERVEVTFYVNGHRLVSHKVAVSAGEAEGVGTFSSSVIVREDGRYAVGVHHAASAEIAAADTKRQSWKVSYPSLKPGECDDVVKGFKKALAQMGYVSGGGSCFNGRLGREVLAYRKVNDKNRNQKAGAGLVKAVFAGRGGYQVRYPKAGNHAEVPLDKQVLVLTKGDKPYAIYPVSTGKPSTPTITGHYTFYRQEPGYNSEGMYYSFYWHNGYAVHGYHEVPNYAASHGCVRTFIADQPRIYEELRFGESIFVF